MRTKAVFGILTSALVVSTAAFGYRSSVFRPMMNFHVIDAGKAYRSAQLTGAELESAIRLYGIRSVINLRGTQPGETWFDDEERTLHKLGVRLINIGFSTDYVPTRDDLVKYLNALSRLPRPILIHCRAGADRTGEASAIYAIEYMHHSREEALQQLSLRYLHVSLFQPAKRYFIEHYQGRKWARRAYDPCSKEFVRFASPNDCPATAQTTLAVLPR